MLTLSKVLGMLCMPLGLLWLGLALSVLWAFKRGSKNLGGFLLFLFLGFTLAGNPQVGGLLIGHLESTIPSFPEDTLQLDALFVLSGGTYVDKNGRPYLNENGDRIMEAARLWHAGRAKRLVVSGLSIGSKDKQRNLGAETRKIWIDIGIPTEAIFQIENPCYITRDEVQAYKNMKDVEGWHRVGLLSSAWHLPRAMALARKANLEVVPVPADRRGSVPSFHLWHIIPHQDAFWCTQVACWEMLGRLVGR